MTDKNIIEIENLDFYYETTRVLHNINLNIKEKAIHSIMGPSGCGKSTLLRCLNRINETSENNVTVTGKILLDSQNVLKMDPIEVRQKIGMVFQKPNPFPHMSIYDNVICGYKFNNIKLSESEKDKIVKNTLQSIGLWDEVKTNLKKKGTFLSGGQQQRLCIARALALKPKVILLDEPTSALDPFASEAVEKLLLDLKKEVSIIMVTHNISQAKRISDHCTFIHLGNIIETNTKNILFNEPKEEKTKDFLKGKFG